MRFQRDLSTYSQYPQRKKKEQKERNDYYYAFNLTNPEGTDHVLLKGDILTSYEHSFPRVLEKMNFKHPPILAGKFRRKRSTRSVTDIAVTDST